MASLPLQLPGWLFKFNIVMYGLELSSVTILLFIVIVQFSSLLLAILSSCFTSCVKFMEHLMFNRKHKRFVALEGLFISLRGRRNVTF